MHQVQQSARECWPAFWKYWWVIVLGPLFGAFEMYERITGADMSLPWLSIAGLVLAIFVAQFLAFHDMRKARDQARAERDELKRVGDYEAALVRLSEMFDEGNNRLFNGKVTSEREYGAWRASWVEWGDRVESHLANNFGPSERYLFRNLVLVRTPEVGGLLGTQHAFERRCVAQQLETMRETIIRHSERIDRWRAKTG